LSLRRLPVFVVLLALSASVAGAQRRKIFSIGGTVREEGTHRALENLQVTVKQMTGPTVNTAYTQGNGDFLIEGLGRGDYILEIAAKDYEPFHQNIAISEASQVGLSIYLSKSGKGPTAGSQGPTPGLQLSISAHQLSVPHKAHDEFEKGMVLMYQKSDYHGAINQFQLAIRDFPTYYEAYAEQGNAYYQLQEMDHAEEALRKSAELSSGQYADGLFTLASLLSDTKRPDEAAATARKGMSVDASSWRGPFELARALTALKQTDEAEKNAQRSRDLMPDNPAVYLLLANIHIQRKDYPGLVRDLDDYLRLSPNGPEADQARKTRERVQNLLNAAKGDSAESGDENTKDDEDADSSSEKPSQQPVQPDTSGLPSLPPPTDRTQ
jgi:tetratricopeptide (TPR) repeat protein